MKKEKKHYNIHTEIYTPTDIERVLQMAVDDSDLKGNNKGEKFYNIPCAFDIETTSFERDILDGREKCSLMYVWQFGINGYIIVGRTWHEYITMMQRISVILGLNHKKRLICYVHNLSYEFQHIRKLFEWERVFSADLRKPIYAITDSGIEFRCSYLLSGYSLAKLGEHLTTYKCAKQVGDLDYNLIRHTTTPLTDKEKQYCVNDVMVVMSYIQESIDNVGSILRLPLTKTGYVRKYCRNKCLLVKDTNGKSKPNYKYISLMRDLTISLDEFEMLQRAFAGGFTHANANYTNDVLTDVDSYDFTSSYPYVMVADKYPMSRGVKVPCRSLAQFNRLISKYCCVFDAEFTDIFASQTQDNPISVSKCIIKDKAVDNNGRLVAANRIVLTITDVDYRIISNFYTWSSMRVGSMYCYRKDYLPTEFVTAILHLYEQKTTLKGVEGKEAEYLHSKEMLNSCYGMCVTNPLRDDFVYNGKWDTATLSTTEKVEMLAVYNNSRNRFLFYPWGVFVTAYARRNLFTAIYALGDDYVYSDTDSVKLLNGKKHTMYFKCYNDTAEYKLRMACKYHGLSMDLCMPDTIKGVTKILGVWDYEGRYNRFKTLGAKRYMTEKDGKVSITCSGVNKQTAIPYLLDKYGKDGIFDAFSNYLFLPPEATGKNTHTYIDYEQHGTITDYLGNTSTFDTQSGIHLEGASYCLSLSVMYLNYLMGIKLKD